MGRVVRAMKVLQCSDFSYVRSADVITCRAKRTDKGTRCGNGCCPDACVQASKRHCRLVVSAGERADHSVKVKHATAPHAELMQPGLA